MKRRAAMTLRAAMTKATKRVLVVQLAAVIAALALQVVPAPQTTIDGFCRNCTGGVR